MTDAPGPLREVRRGETEGTVVRGLSVVYGRSSHRINAVHGVDLTVAPGEKRAVVGESGSGKTTLGRAIARLLPAGAEVVAGSIRIDGVEVTRLEGAALVRARRTLVGVVLQDPLNALDPLRTISSQVAEAVKARVPHSGRWSRRDLQFAVRTLLEDCQLDNAEAVMKQYPHELSGGMRQRVTIAMAVVGACRLLIADEPTTALDVVTQAGIAQLIDSTVRRHAMSLIFITHNLALASELCTTVSIMYGGAIVEDGGLDEVMNEPIHPYTRGLLASVPVLGAGKRSLTAIPGAPPSLQDIPTQGCVFEPRCGAGHGQVVCRSQVPPIKYVREPGDGDPGHWGRCHFIAGRAVGPSKGTAD